MSYSKPYTLNNVPGGDTVRSAIVDKCDGNITAIFANLNTHEALSEIHGATGALVGTTNTQTLTNKTLTTPVIATLYIDAAKTKLMSFPDVASDTIVLVAAAQTLTNKTLTSPTLTTPTIASFVNATHTHAAAASGGVIPYTSISPLSQYYILGRTTAGSGACEALPASFVTLDFLNSSSATTAREKLGCGTMATQNANAVAITGGNINLASGELYGAYVRSCQLESCGITSLIAPLGVANGGTAATTAAGARTNLGLGSFAVMSAPNTIANVLSDHTQEAHNALSITPGNTTVGTSQLKTSTGEVSFTATSSQGQHLTLPGGSYGFYPQIKTSGLSETTMGRAIILFERSSDLSSYTTIIFLGITTNPIEGGGNGGE